MKEIVAGREFHWLENTEQCPCMKALDSKEKAATETFLNALEAGIICIYTAASTRMERVKEARYESGFSYLFRLGGKSSFF
jgi:hypothetical protein